MTHVVNKLIMLKCWYAFRTLDSSYKLSRVSRITCVSQQPNHSQMRTCKTLDNSYKLTPHSRITHIANNLIIFKCRNAFRALDSSQIYLLFRRIQILLSELQWRTEDLNADMTKPNVIDARSLTFSQLWFSQNCSRVSIFRQVQEKVRHNSIVNSPSGHSILKAVQPQLVTEGCHRKQFAKIRNTINPTSNFQTFLRAWMLKNLETKIKSSEILATYKVDKEAVFW